jgi:flagellar protein FliS
MFTAAFNQGARAYARVGVETGVAAADPHRLVEMLFDGALAKIAIAREAIFARDTARRGEAVSQAITIISQGLRASLDHEVGGSIAAQLDALYDYMTVRLVQGGANNHAANLDEVAGLLGELRAAWTAIRPAGVSTATQRIPAEV